MSGPLPTDPIGDREVDRLLALVPPPPAVPPGLADRIAARAAATAQVPPLPPRRALRTIRRPPRGRTWAGGLMGSFLLTVAAAAAVLTGHIDLHRLATLPALLFNRHPDHAPARAAMKLLASKPYAPAAVPTVGREEAVALPFMPAAPVPVDPAAPSTRTGSPGAVRPPFAAIQEHRPTVRESARSAAIAGERRPSVRAIAMRPTDHDHVSRTRPERPAPVAGIHASSAVARDDSVAEANREALRATEWTQEVERQHAAAKSEEQARPGTGISERLRRPGWRRQGTPAWRGRGQGRFAQSRMRADDGPGVARETLEAGPTPPAATAKAKPDRAAKSQNARHRGGRAGRGRGRKR